MRIYVSIGVIALFVIGSGCAAVRSHTSASERSYALKAALLHTWARWGVNPQTHTPFYVLVEGETTDWLLKEFRGHRPAVVGMKEERAYKWRPDELPYWTMVVRWAASIKAIGNHHATV